MSATSVLNDHSARASKTSYTNYATSSNSRAIEIESWKYVKHKEHNLHLLQKNEVKTTRPEIPATRGQILTFFRCYTTSLYKTHYITVQDLHLGIFVIMCLVNCAFKTIPTTYIHVFLSVYAPEEHLFLSKMSVISYGVNFQIILTSLLEFIAVVYQLMRSSHYFIIGLIGDDTLNRCHIKNFFYLKKVVRCIEVKEFRNAIQHTNVTAFGSIYIIDGKFYELSHTVFGRMHARGLRNMVYFRGESWIYPIIILVITSVWSPLYKAQFWKSFQRIHVALNIMKVLAILHLILLYVETGLPEPKIKLDKNVYEWAKLVLQVNLDFVAESMTAPPVLHFLLSRCTYSIHPTTETFLMTFSNTLYYIFQALTTVAVRAHCEAHLSAAFRSHTSSFPWFHLFPLYYSTSFEAGEIITTLFFGLVFLEEFCVFSITFHSLVEIILCEWPKVKRWMVTSGMCVFVMLHLVTASYRFLMNCLFYSKALVTLTELVVVVVLYPSSRLIDDIEFHFGSHVSGAKAALIKLTLIYYAYKVQNFFTVYWRYLSLTEKYQDQKNSGKYWSWSLNLVVLAIGTISIIIYTLVKKKNCGSLFRPLPTWGPREHIQRQLRKQYDSEEYVCSQSSRYLSRYLMSKRQTQTYKLDICYDNTGKA